MLYMLCDRAGVRSLTTCSLWILVEHMSEGICSCNSVAKTAEREPCGVHTSGARRLPAVSAARVSGWRCSRCCQRCC